MKWVALFSQTGSEIVELSKRLQLKPDLILTNNNSYTGVKPEINKVAPTIYGSHNQLMKYLVEPGNLDPDDTIITLHGYLRILPAEVCEMFKVYNGHPGAIDLYPELKGKDPQVRAWNGNYRTIGSVVHKVTPEVDEGEILVKQHLTNNCKSLDEMYSTLKSLSLQSWQQFMRENFNENWNNGCSVCR